MHRNTLVPGATVLTCVRARLSPANPPLQHSSFPPFPADPTFIYEWNLNFSHSLAEDGILYLAENLIERYNYPTNARYFSPVTRRNFRTN